LARNVPDDALESCVPKALRARLHDRGGESEHRLAAVAFVKFKGVDQFLGSRGPDATADALDTIVRTVQEAADQEDVAFLASDIDADGGKIILTAGVPVAREDDEGRLLRTARAVMDQELPLPVRVGLNRGHVFSGDIGTEFRRTFTIMGDTVNLAARMMAAAQPGEILSTGPVLDEAATRFEAETLEPIMVKGKSEPVQPYRVGASKGAKVAALGALPFRGRDKELTTLLEAAADARAGTGKVVVVEAERGAGKSRLVAELLEAAAPAQILTLQGEPHAAALAYLPFHAGLRRLMGVDDDDRAKAGHQLTAAVAERCPGLTPYVALLAPLVDAQAAATPESEAIAVEFARDKVAELLSELLGAQCPQGLAIVMEDAHWFDDTTSTICARLLAVAPERGWLVCVTRRPGPGGLAPAEAQVVVSLPPLTSDAAAGLIDVMTDAMPLRPQDRDEVVARAGGNPLFLEELLRAVRTTDVEGLPSSIDAVAMREIDSLPTTARRALLLASVLGRSFTRDLLLDLLADEGIETGALTVELLREQLVAESQEALRFRHAMLQEAAYQSLPFRARKTLHEKVGAVIERTSPDVAAASAVLSFHFLAAQDWDRTWRYARLAATAAAAANAPGEAADQLERAVTASRRLATVDDDELGRVLAQLGDFLVVNGEYERADDAFRRAAATSKHDPLRGARIAERRVYLLGEFLGRYTLAIRQARRADALIDELGPERGEAGGLHAVLLAREADVRRRQGRLAEADRTSRQAISEAESAGDIGALAIAHSVLGGLLAMAGHEEAGAHFRRSLELYEEIGDLVHVAMTLNNLGFASCYRTAWVEAGAEFADAISASIRVGDLATAAISRMNLGEIRLNQGRVTEAAELLGEARRTFVAFADDLFAAYAAMHLGRALYLAGEREKGEALLRSAVTTFDDIHARVQSMEARARLAEILMLDGRLTEASDALDQARTMERQLEEMQLAVLLDRLELTLMAASGDLATVGSRLEAVLEHAQRLGATHDAYVVAELARRSGLTPAGVDVDELGRELGIVDLVLPTVPSPR
ncbi:MAG TPA: AAA family ATPase, partial [Acidimicrobiales bacterium]|nr:AAA family ATPase [Acidimicrobiales bacterium]